MLDCLKKRRDELMQKIDALEKQSIAAADDAEREKIDGEAERLAERVELYRAAGPLTFFDYPQQARGYLEFLAAETFGEVLPEYFAEIQHARALVDALQDRPLF